MTIPKFSMAGKSALIVGAKRGIGRAIALGFAESGADVAIATRNVDDGKLNAVAGEIKKLGRRSLAIQADISRKSDVDKMVQRMVKEFGTIDVLVNTAAILKLTPIMDLSEVEWDEVLDTDLKGYFLTSQAAARVMIEKQRGGAIINFATYAAFVARDGCGAYSTAKAGVVMLTKVFASELAQHSIRVNCIAPFMLNTELYSFPGWGDKEFIKYRETLVPLGKRVRAEPSDAVGAALFLASDEAARYVTGHTLMLDGGASIYR